MNFIACDGKWTTTDGNIQCNGTLHAVTQDQLGSKPGLSYEDADQLADMTIVLLVGVWCILALKKAIQ